MLTRFGKAAALMAAAAVLARLSSPRVRAMLPRGGGGSSHDDAGDCPVGAEPVDERMLHRARLTDLGATASMVVHELRQPLFTIGLAAENGLAMLADVEGEAAAAARMKFERIAGQVDRMTNIIPRLLAYSRPADEAASCATVGDAVEAATMYMAPVARDAGIQLIVDAQPAAEARVRINQVHLEQVIVNALRNAFDAIDGCAANLRGQPEVRVIARRAADHVSIDVDDTGPGLSPEATERAFEAFYTTKGSGKGTGLGLHICRLIVASAGGTAALRNRSSGGARFSIVLPLRDDC